MPKALQSFTHANTGRVIAEGDILAADDPVVVSVPSLFEADMPERSKADKPKRSKGDD